MDDVLTIKTDIVMQVQLGYSFQRADAQATHIHNVMKVRILKLGLMQQESAQAVNTLLSLNQSDITVTLLWDNHRQEGDKKTPSA